LEDTLVSWVQILPGPLLFFLGYNGLLNKQSLSLMVPIDSDAQRSKIFMGQLHESYLCDNFGLKKLKNGMGISIKKSIPDLISLVGEDRALFELKAVNLPLREIEETDSYPCSFEYFRLMTTQIVGHAATIRRNRVPLYWIFMQSQTQENPITLVRQSGIVEESDILRRDLYVVPFNAWQLATHKREPIGTQEKPYTLVRELAEAEKKNYVHMSLSRLKRENNFNVFPVHPRTTLNLQTRIARRVAPHFKL
jgi:hypothetical protein